MALMNLTNEIKKAEKSIEQIKFLASTKDFSKDRNKGLYMEQLINCRTIVRKYKYYISDVLDAIIELYKREDKQVVGVPSTKDYIKHRKALDSLVFSNEGNIVHLQIHEDMDKSSYRITILENDQLKAERL